MRKGLIIMGALGLGYAVLPFLLAPHGFLISSVTMKWALAIIGAGMVGGIVWGIHARQPLALTLASLLILWGSIETGFFLWDRHSPRQRPEEILEGTYGKQSGVEDRSLGYRLKPNLDQVTAKKRIAGKLAYDVTYSTDEWGRRKTFLSEPKRKERYLAFFGCSYTFGEGVNDDETLPSRMAKLFPDSRVYNYGLSGYGPQEMLARLEENEFSKEIEEREGTIYYVFMDGHIQRAIGSAYVYNQWGPNMPYYTNSREGLERRGNFTTGRPITSLAYLVLGHSFVYRHWGGDLPALKPSHFELVAEILRKSEQLAKERIHASKLVTIIYPGSQWGETLIPYLNARGLESLDYSRLFPFFPEGGAYQIPLDGHPNAKAHELLAERLRDSVIGREY